MDLLLPVITYVASVIISLIPIIMIITYYYMFESEMEKELDRP